MTPNKLPPLPESLKNLADIVAILLKPVQWRTYKIGERIAKVAEEMNDAEALRQSQSLPAGAVAGLVGKWRGELIDLVEVPSNESQRRANALAKIYNCALTACADELEQALQADAREKGEAAEIEPDWKLIAVNGKAFDDLVYWLNELDLPNVLDKAWAAFDYRLATQPAQASEPAAIDSSSTYSKPIGEPVGAEAVGDELIQLGESMNAYAATWCGDEDERVSVEARHANERRDLIRKLATHPQPVTPAGGEVGRFVPCTCHDQRQRELCMNKHECSVVNAQSSAHPPVADAALVRDADRWRMLKQLDGTVAWRTKHDAHSTGISQDYGNLDAAIDAAIQDAALNQRGGGGNG